MKKKWILVILVVFLASLIVGYLRYTGVSKMPLIVSEAELPALEVKVSYLDSQPQYIKDLIWCESRGNPNAVGDGGKAFGLLQFHLPTAWAYNEKYEYNPKDLSKWKVLDL